MGPSVWHCGTAPVSFPGRQPPVNGRAGWRAVVRGNVLALAVVSLLNDAASEMIYPLLPLFLTGVLGATPAMLGLIEGVADSTASFVKLVSGQVSDRLRRRKSLVVWGYGVAAVARPMIALVSAAWHVLVIRFADRIGKGVRTAPRDALLAESVDAPYRGRAFGVHRAADHAGAVIGPLAASALLLLLDNDLRAVFLIAAVPGVLALVVVWLGVRETAGTAQGARVAATGGTTTGVAAAAPANARVRLVWHEIDAPLLRFLPVVALFTLGNATDAFLLVRAQQLGVPIALLPMLWAVHHVAKMAGSVPGGALADRFGARRIIIAGWLVYAAVYTGFALASTALHAWLLFVLYGAFYALTESPEKALVAEYSTATRRGAAFGAYHFAIGITALPASVIFGLVWQRFSPGAAFALGAALALAAALLLSAQRAGHYEAQPERDRLSR